jgi:hypothetical protein
MRLRALLARVFSKALPSPRLIIGPDTHPNLPRASPPVVKAECDSSTRVEVTGIGYLSTRCRFERSLVSGVCGSSPKVIR